MDLRLCHRCSGVCHALPFVTQTIVKKNVSGFNNIGSRVSLLLYLFFTGVSPSFAQVYPFDHYTSKDGLLMDYVIALCCDSRGYVWVGTNDGVSLYNGEVFRNFTVADGLSYSRVNCIVESRAHPGTIWIGTNGGGISKWRSNKFQTYRINGEHSSNIITALMEDRHGVLWCGTDNGLFTLADNECRRIRPAVIKGTVVGVAQSPDGTIWVLMSDKLYAFPPDSDDPRVVNLHCKPAIVPQCIYASDDTTFWIGMSNGGIVQMRDGEILRRLVIKNAIINVMLDDRDGLLFGTTRGIYRLPDTGSAPIPFCSTSNGLPEDFISSAAIDMEGDLWLGLGSKGVAKLANRTVFTYPLSGLIFPPNGSAAAMDQDEHLWVASWNGIYELWKGNNAAWQSTLHKELSDVTDEKPYTVLFDPPSSLWAGFQGGDIICFAIGSRKEGPSSLTIQHRWRQGSEYRSGGMPIFLFKDREGYLWCSISDNRGLYLFDPKRAKPFLRSYTEEDGMPDNSTRAICEDREGNFWFGGYDNGLTFLPSSKKFQGGGRRFTSEDGLPNQSIRSILQDSAGVIWAGTRYGGIAYLRDSVFHPLSLNEGLLSTAVWSMILDADRHQWLGTQLGFQEMTASGMIKFHSKKELSGSPVYACGEMKDGVLWLVTDAGITFYDRRHDVSGNIPPPVYISRVLVSGVEVDADSSHEFAYDQNNISLDVIGLSLKDEKAVQYQYKLLGTDTGWSAPTRNHLIMFAALSPGKYSFMARAINGNGTVSTQAATFSFRIVPALWRQWWFIVSSVLIVVAVSFLLVRSRVKRLIEIERIKSRLAADLHDDIGAGLTRIAILSSVIERDMPGKAGVDPGESTAGESLKRIGDTARDLVESMSDVVWSLGLTEEPLERLVQRLRLFAFEACEAKNIVLKFTIDDNIFALHFPPERARNILLCAKEAITNIVRHSDCSEANIELLQDGNRVVLTVTDDGKGFQAGGSHTGHGLTNMKKRAEGSGGSFTMISQAGKGTRIQAIFPAAP